MFVSSHSASRVPQATLVLSLSILSILSLLPTANAAPTPDPTVPTTPQQLLETRAEEPASRSRSSLPVPALLAILGVSLFVLLLGTTLAYMYTRRRRVRQKRAEHRERAVQFQEMHRAGTRPYYYVAPSNVSLNSGLGMKPVADEKKGPRYPVKAYVV